VVQKTPGKGVVLSTADVVILLTVIDAYRERYRVKDDPAMAAVLRGRAKDAVNLLDIEAWVEGLRKQHSGPKHSQDSEFHTPNSKKANL
jgi:hypothetical protein